jgi:hypothetical protein
VERDLAALRSLEAECRWLEVVAAIGHGPTWYIVLGLRVPAWAWRAGEAPVLRPGPWQTHILLIRELLCQPMVKIRPDAGGFLPVSGNVSDWTSGATLLHEEGLVCYADHWDPRLSLCSIAFSVVQIVVGQSFTLEARALSPAGRDWQSRAFESGKLPTCVVPSPRPELLCVESFNPLPAQGTVPGIEFDAE